MTDDCRECKQPLLEIGNRGEHLTGCMACNIWWSQEGKKVVRLSVEDLHAWTRFICAGDLAKAIYRGEIRRRKRDSDAGSMVCR